MLVIAVRLTAVAQHLYWVVYSLLNPKMNKFPNFWLWKWLFLAVVFDCTGHCLQSPAMLVWIMNSESPIPYLLVKPLTNCRNTVLFLLFYHICSPCFLLFFNCYFYVLFRSPTVLSTIYPESRERQNHVIGKDLWNPALFLTIKPITVNLHFPQECIIYSLDALDRNSMFLSCMSTCNAESTFGKLCETVHYGLFVSSLIKRRTTIYRIVYHTGGPGSNLSWVVAICSCVLE
jgi:hypothetical protein